MTELEFKTELKNGAKNIKKYLEEKGYTVFGLHEYEIDETGFTVQKDVLRASVTYTSFAVYNAGVHYNSLTNFWDIPYGSNDTAFRLLASRIDGLFSGVRFQMSNWPRLDWTTKTPYNRKRKVLGKLRDIVISEKSYEEYYGEQYIASKHNRFMWSDDSQTEGYILLNEEKTIITVIEFCRRKGIKIQKIGDDIYRGVSPYLSPKLFKVSL